MPPVSTFLVYVDESYDDSRFSLSGLVVRDLDWRPSFDMLKSYRADLRRDHGVFLRKEIHARELVAGRGRISAAPIPKFERSRIFLSALKLAATLPNAWVVNVCLPVGGLADVALIDKAWDRLLNRIERTMLANEEREIPLRRKLSDAVKGSLGETAAETGQTMERLLPYHSASIIVADEGHDRQITRALRRKHAFNPVPSARGDWGDGQPVKNIVLSHVIEDPVFRRSADSYFLQIVDCIVFALLKREVPPTPLVARYGIHKMFDVALQGICFKKASPKDPLGIVRS